MKASIGRIVITKGAITSNGTDEHPAIINRTWSNADTEEGPVYVNTTVLPDCGVPTCVTSIALFDNRAAAEAAFTSHGGRVAFWPDRV